MRVGRASARSSRRPRSTHARRRLAPQAVRADATGSSAAAGQPTRGRDRGCAHRGADHEPVPFGGCAVGATYRAPVRVDHPPGYGLSVVTAGLAGDQAPGLERSRVGRSDGVARRRRPRSRSTCGAAIDVPASQPQPGSGRLPCLAGRVLRIPAGAAMSTVVFAVVREPGQPARIVDRGDRHDVREVERGRQDRPALLSLSAPSLPAEATNSIPELAIASYSSGAVLRPAASAPRVVGDQDPERLRVVDRLDGLRVEPAVGVVAEELQGHDRDVRGDAHDARRR